MNFIFLLLPIIAFSASQIPSRAKRMHALKQAGLTQFASTLDELDQDILYMRTQHSSPEELKKFYPQLSMAKIQALKAAL